MIKKTYEEKGEGDWYPKDRTLRYTDWRNNYLDFSGHTIEITYVPKNAVEDEMNYSALALNSSPNPSSGPLNISYELTEPVNVTLSINNIMGIEMIKLISDQIQLPGTYNTNCEVSSFVPGTYFIIIQSGNSTQVKKFLVD